MRTKKKFIESLIPLKEFAKHFCILQILIIESFIGKKYLMELLKLTDRIFKSYFY